MLTVENNAQYNKGDSIVIGAVASANNGGTIDKVEFYNGSTLVSTATQAPYLCDMSSLADGTYFISARAYDNNGTATQATAAQIHVNSIAGTAGYESIDIGAPGVAGSSSLEKGVLTVKGAGKVGKAEGSVDGVPADATTDSFHYVFKGLKGDGTIVAKLDDVTAIDNHAGTGLMIRESTAANANAAFLSMSLVKQNTKLNEGNPDLDDTTWAVLLANRGATAVTSDKGEALKAAKAGIPLVEDFYFRTAKNGKSVTNGVWLKLERKGNVFTGYARNNTNESWKLIGSAEIPMGEEVLIGFAVDGNKVANDIDNLSTAKFSNISIK